MKRFMEEKGISPIIATILLIATTAIAAGVIAAYVSGLYVSSARLSPTASVSATLFDWDNTATQDNYKNGNISLVITLTAGRLRNFGDPSYGGTTITVTDTVTGYSQSVSFDNTDAWGSTATKSSTATPSGWSSGTVVMTVSANPDTSGKIGSGSSIVITLAINGASAHSTESSVIDNRMNNDTIWDEKDPMSISISGRDSLTASVYSLYGRAWSV